MRTLIAALLTAGVLAGCALTQREYPELSPPRAAVIEPLRAQRPLLALVLGAGRSEEHTSELQSH